MAKVTEITPWRCGKNCDCPSDFCAADQFHALASAQPVLPRRSWRLPSLRLVHALAAWARRLFGRFRP